MIAYFQTKKKLKQQLLQIESRVIERERKKYLEEKMLLINDYESRIISEAQKAADERERQFLSILEKKDKKIRELELEINNQRVNYRNFKQEVQQYEMITDELCTALEIGKMSVIQMGAKFEGIRDKMTRVVQKIERKDKKLIEEMK